MNETWDRQVDVVVAGYGFAGAVTAAVAKDAGAQVLILEKGPYPGGCLNVGGANVFCASDARKAMQYLTAIQGGRVEEELTRVFAEHLTENEEFLRGMARVNGARIQPVHNTMWYSSGYGSEPVSVDYSGSYPYPGADGLYKMGVGEVPGFHGHPWVPGAGAGPGMRLIKLFIDNVESRRIEVSFSTAAKRLVTDDQGQVVGVIAEKDGKESRIKTRRAVVLATGGFEQNAWMHHQYLQGKPFISVGPLTNTGDGIKMAQKVGAALWHMWHVHGSYGYKWHGHPVGLRHPFGGARNLNRRMPWIVVDKFGSRYMNEYQPCPQDTNHRAMEIFDPDLPGYPRIPSYLVFDEKGRTWGPIATPRHFVDFPYTWSHDNQVEIDQGWIVKGASLRELAVRIRELPGNEGRLNPQALEKTVEKWNGIVEEGRDPLWRPPKSMMAIDTPPFYAIEVWPVITNTQGGPVHNVRQQVMDPFEQPIPRLYSVGELGSIFAHLYQVSGNLGECVTSGRIAGKFAAAEKPLA